LQARQVKELPEVSEEDEEEGDADGEAHSPQEDAFPSDGAECGGTRHTSGMDSDFEKEQRVNAELKQRYRSLTQAAAIDVSDGGPAAPLRASCLNTRALQHP